MKKLTKNQRQAIYAKTCSHYTELKQKILRQAFIDGLNSEKPSEVSNA